MESAGNTRILAHAEHRSTALVWRVACDAFLRVLMQAFNLAHKAATADPAFRRQFRLTPDEEALLDRKSVV